jgi:tripartite-type tricarboxylate transporter receptor subunit TctC
MKIPRRQFLHLAAGAAAFPAVARIARAQAYPTRPITIIVPYPAGGTNDVLPRIIAEKMRASLGQPLVIENVSGAGGSIGVGRVARAASDGYTLGIGSSDTHVLNGAVYRLGYDLLKDIEPIALIAKEPLLIVARRDLPARDLKEMISWLNANHEKVSMGTLGTGSSQQLCGVELQNITGVSWSLVPYRGAAPLLQDLLGGQIDLTCAPPAIALPLIQGGQIKAFAVAAKNRLASAPDIPSVDEVGLDGFYTPSQFGLWAPKGTPTDIIAMLNAAVVAALADPANRRRIADLGLEIPPREEQSPEALRAFQKAEIEKWWPIIKAANIKAE